MQELCNLMCLFLEKQNFVHTKSRSPNLNKVVIENSFQIPNTYQSDY